MKSVLFYSLAASTTRFGQVLSSYHYIKNFLLDSTENEKLIKILHI